MTPQALSDVASIAPRIHGIADFTRAFLELGERLLAEGAGSTPRSAVGRTHIGKVYLGARRVHEHGGRLASRGIQSVRDRLFEG